MSMRHTEACERCERHEISMPDPSTQATAAFIGETWVTTATSRSLARSVSSRHAVPHPLAEGGQRLASLRRPRDVRLPVVPRLGREVGVGGALVRAVGELDPPLVGGVRLAEELRRLRGPAQRAGDQLVDRADVGHDRLRLLPPDVVERDRRGDPAAAPRRSAPCGRGGPGSAQPTVNHDLRARSGGFGEQSSGAPRRRSPGSIVAGEPSARPTPGWRGRRARAGRSTSPAPPPGARRPRSSTRRTATRTRRCRPMLRRRRGGAAWRSAARATAAAATGDRPSPASPRPAAPG